MIKKFFTFLKWVARFFLKFLGVIILLLLLSGGFSYFHYDKGYNSVSKEEQNLVFSGVDRGAFILTDSGSNRRSGNTFMSIPEWYIVSISDDFSTWIESGKNPSNFPYFRYLADMWYMYGRITALMDGVIPRDYEYHTMVRVISASTTLELGVKALYENTLGRVSSLFGYDTEEDIYYQKFQNEYVEFILLRPWYEFPFGETASNFHLSSWNIRSVERYFIQSVEFSLKKLYAGVIENAAHANFALPNIWTEVSGVALSGSVTSLSGMIEESGSGIRIARYFPFTEHFPSVVSSHAGEPLLIAGNTHVVSEFSSDAQDNESFLQLEVPINPGHYRAFYYTDTKALQTKLKSPKNNLLHIYDF